MSLKITPTDSIKEQEGVWTKYLNVDLKIARGSNPKYLSELAKRSRTFESRFKKSKASNKEMTEALCQSAARYLLVDWKNFKPGNDNVPYSIDNAVDLLTSDIDCRQFILDFSDDLDNYLAEETEQTLGK